jgi:hypothetical protein
VLPLAVFVSGLDLEDHVDAGSYAAGLDIFDHYYTEVDDDVGYSYYGTDDFQVDDLVPHDLNNSKGGKDSAIQTAEPTIRPPQCAPAGDVFGLGPPLPARLKGQRRVALQPAVLRYNAERAALWELWNAAFGADKPSAPYLTTAGSPAAVVGAQRSPYPAQHGNTEPQLSGTRTAAVQTTEMCKAWQDQASRQAAAAGGMYKILIACTILTITMAVGLCFALYATRLSYPIRGPGHPAGHSTLPPHDAATVNWLISSWLQHQLRPGFLSQLGHLLAAVVPVLGMFGVPGVCPGVAADLAMTREDSWLLMMGIVAFLICCGITMLAAVVVPCSNAGLLPT